MTDQCFALENYRQQLELGKPSKYTATYNPRLLFPIPRQPQRREMGIPDPLPFVGCDIWNHYEVSWLNEKGKPQVAVAEMMYGCDSAYLIESKSMKLYFNSFNNTRFKDKEAVLRTVRRDLEATIAAPLAITLTLLHDYSPSVIQDPQGEVIDALDIETSCYTVYPDFLTTGSETTREVLCSHLLKSNCWVTHQPDWGTVTLAYQGKKINREGLLKYIISFRNHHEFHEPCIERIFMDIQKRCQPEVLTVYGRYTRRGGIDINPIRSSTAVAPENRRTARQ